MTIHEDINKIVETANKEDNDIVDAVKTALKNIKDVDTQNIILPYKDAPLRVRIPYKSYFKDDYQGKDERPQLAAALKNTKGFMPTYIIHVRLGKVDGFEVTFKKR